MIDLKLLKNNFEFVKQGLTNKKVSSNTLKQIVLLEDKLRTLKKHEDDFNAQRNKIAKQINLAYSLNKQSEATDLQQKMKDIKAEINNISDKLNQVELDFENLMLTIPNLPDQSVKVGEDENDNKVEFEWGQKPVFNFNFKNHYDLAEELGLVDFQLGPKLSGSRFVVYKGLGAKLYNALSQYTLDLQVNKNGYLPYVVPVIVEQHTLYNTTQLPKFEEDLFKINGTNKYLSSTGEVQLINLYADQILNTSDLPIKLTTNSLCFRKEAGAAGKDTRGLIRLHQFNKTELVIICAAQQSYQLLETITENAQKVLEDLKLPYRRISLCTGDLGFAAAKTYDLEVWLPSENKYREISSCSNTTDFQTRRSKIRHRSSVKNKTELAHALNGSGVAIDRLFAALIENNQQKDGSILIPEPLRPYMNGLEKITKVK